MSQKTKIKCPLGSEGSEASANVDSTSIAWENDQKLSEVQVLSTATAVECQRHQSQLSEDERMSQVDSSATFIRSSSESNISASISPLPSVSDAHQGREKCRVIFRDNVKLHQRCENRGIAMESDIFLNASMQLMHLNGVAQQRLRQLWALVQQLGRDNQISDSGMDLLYAELGNILKGLGAEKLEPAKHLRSGRLILLASSSASDFGTLASDAPVKALFGLRSSAQLMQCSILEEQCKFEMTPTREKIVSSPSGVASSPPASTSGRFTLPSTAALMGMLSDAFQEEPTTRIIRLQGCQVRRLVPKSVNDGVDTTEEKVSSRTLYHRFQLLVPYKFHMESTMDNDRVDVQVTRAPVPYESFIFEVPTQTSGEIEADMEAQAQVDDWVWALDRVCRSQLYRLKHALQEAPTIERYRETLHGHFPVCVSLSWLRNQADKQALQRRASANLSMIQIVKDLGRDQIMLDGQLYSPANPFKGDDDNRELDSVSEVVKYMVKKVLDYEQETTTQHRDPGLLSHQPSSPAHRFAKHCEARALAFVERVLQGSSRTQSGGDIYDAISFFCQQEHVSICPVSQDARPVQMQILIDAANCVFQVEVQVCMQFKVIELTPRSPARVLDEEGSKSLAPDVTGTSSSGMSSPRESLRVWATLEGTMSRHFTFGQLAAPGTVTINYIPSKET